MTPSQRIQLVPYSDDPLAHLAQQLLQHYRQQLPRLDRATVVLPDSGSDVRLRRLLLEQAAAIGWDALLGPRITTLRAWLNDRTAMSSQHTVVHNYQRHLILVEALREHRNLFGNGNLWAMADSLLSLFDELTLNDVSLPSDLGQFTANLANGYGLQSGYPEALHREAQLVHTLWHAYHQQLHARGLIDANTRYLLQLGMTLQQPQSETIFMAGLPTLCKAEQAWLEGMLSRNQLVLYLQGEALGSVPPQTYHPDTPLQALQTALGLQWTASLPGDAFNAILRAIFHCPGSASAMRERARQFCREHPVSPLRERIALYHANGDEEEARAVELQVRRWLLAGQRRIAIVSENRRLARRVRALLERADIAIHDASGWALSTTSAASALEQWLQCVEEDFSHQPMLDLLKSPFLFAGSEREHHLGTVYRLEQDIVLHENIGSGLQRYLRQCRFRQHRLPDELAAALDGVISLLQRLGEAAAPLLPLLHGDHLAADYLDCLQASLESLELGAGLEADAAGAQVMDTLLQMQRAVSGETQLLSWLEFRGWLGRNLEASHFLPVNPQLGISLMGLAQSQLQRFDALIIAGMEREFMPGAPADSPFFNEAVRSELGLPTGESRLAERFFHFRRLLESSGTVLLTLRRQQDGEDILPSPWLEALRSFHRLAYADDLEERELAWLVGRPEAEVVDRSTPLPAVTPPPRPTADPALLPRRYSASAYQQLLDCPYQFYAARMLRLAPPEAIREALEKSDYGERVHRILQAFHGKVAGLPGPFTGRLDAQTRDRAEALLEAISRAVFAEDLEDNFLHRGWLQRWLEKIPAYLDWQMAREEVARVESVEADIKLDALAPGLSLQGRLDRIDRMGEALAIVDYKTGTIPGEEQVLGGEAVQLPFYALLARQMPQPLAQVEYLALDGVKLGSKATLSGEALEQLCDANAARLLTLQHEMSQAHALPAWGDEKVCSYCPMEGLCRRGTWPQQEAPGQ